MTVVVYRSSDASAPVLTGVAGSLVAVLTACLVNGYGALPAAGWGLAYSGTNKAVYRAAAGNRMYLRVDDTGGQHARIRGYEAMSGVDTGTEPFPTDAQVSGGLYVYKSITTDGTARGWVLVANEEMFYFLPVASNSDWFTSIHGNVSGQFGFGEFESHKAGDTFNTILFGATSTGANECRFGTQFTHSTTFSPNTGHYLPRSYLGTGTSTPCGKRVLFDPTTNSTMGGTSYYGAFPDPVTGEMVVSPVMVLEADGSNRAIFRGRMPGLWGALHSLPAAHGDTIAGSGTTSGKTFQLVQSAGASTEGRVLLEISDTW